MENNKVINDKKKENSKYWKDFFAVCFFPLAIFVIGCLLYSREVNSLSECTYSQGVFESLNSYYKTITLKKEIPPEKIDIPCSRISSICYFKFGSGSLFDDIKNKLENDSTEHYIQIWFTYSNSSRPIVEGGIGLGYSQVIVDGEIILPFDKWRYRKCPIFMMIFGIVLLFLWIKFGLKNHRKDNDDLF